MVKSKEEALTIKAINRITVIVIPPHAVPVANDVDIPTGRKDYFVATFQCTLLTQMSIYTTYL